MFIDCLAEHGPTNLGALLKVFLRLWKIFLHHCPSQLCIQDYETKSKQNSKSTRRHMYLHCALAAAQCIVIGPVCRFVAVFVGLLPR